MHRTSAGPGRGAASAQVALSQLRCPVILQCKYVANARQDIAAVHTELLLELGRTTTPAGAR